MPRYYVIDRHRKTITLDYVNNNLEQFKCFNTYDEAYQYEINTFFDDSEHGIFYRTENDDFLLIRKRLL